MSWEEIFNAAVNGTAISLVGGLLSYVTGLNTGVNASLKSMGKVFVLSTGVIYAVEKGSNELKKSQIP